MQGEEGGVLLKNLEEEMQWFRKMTPIELSSQVLMSWGLSETFGSQNIFLIAEEHAHTLLKFKSVRLLGVVNIVNKYRNEASGCGIQTPGPALGTSQIETGSCSPAGVPYEFHFVVTAKGSPHRSRSSGPPDFPFFKITIPRMQQLEPDEVVKEDETDEVDVGAEGGEEHTELLRPNIRIIERMTDGSGAEIQTADMTLINCSGYFSFAQKLRGLYYGNQQLKPIPHVLWPWPGYSTIYMAQHNKEMDPRAMPWSSFSADLRDIFVSAIHMSDTKMLPIEFHTSDGNETPFHIPLEFITKFKCFLATVHIAWSGWKSAEPMDPDKITDETMVGSSFIEFYDADGTDLDIPTILSVRPRDNSCNENDVDENASVKDFLQKLALIVVTDYI